MKTHITARIVFESNRYGEPLNSKNPVTIDKIVKAIRSGEAEMKEVCWNELEYNPTIMLVYTDKDK